MSDTADDPEAESGALDTSVKSLAIYLIIGIVFGVILVKSEVVSWFRIQEMFRFQSFYMYGVIGSAVVTAAVSLVVIRRLGLRSLSGERIEVPPKRMGNGTRYWLGGAIFGLGWGLGGACPGPLFALLGSGLSIILVPMFFAVAGTRLYGALRQRLPH
ncbi:MAG: YeeE/YedE family protein [Gemmatimonadota bacterium]|nr:YeeE/YedE family protein [Gemmatimonadota bacterium]